MHVWCLAYRRTSHWRTHTQSLFSHYFFFSHRHTHQCTHMPRPVWCCFQHKTKPCVGAILCWAKLYALSVLCSSTRKKLGRCLLPVSLLTIGLPVPLVFMFVPLCVLLTACVFAPACLPFFFTSHLLPFGFLFITAPLPLAVHPHLLACIVLICTPFSICLPV